MINLERSSIYNSVKWRLTNCYYNQRKNNSFPLSIQFSDSSLLHAPLSSVSYSIVPVGTVTAIVTTTTPTGGTGLPMSVCGINYIYEQTN